MKRLTLALFLTSCTPATNVHIDANLDMVRDGGAVSPPDGSDGSTPIDGFPIDGSQVDGATLTDGANPDLSCLAAVANPFSETPCMPGQEQNATTPNGSCIKKICGCKDQAACTGCFWSPWISCNR